MAESRYEFNDKIILQLANQTTITLVAQELLLDDAIMLQFRDASDALNFVDWAKVKLPHCDFPGALDRALAVNNTLMKPAFPVKRNHYEALHDLIRPKQRSRKFFCGNGICEETNDALRIRIFGLNVYFDFARKQDKLTMMAIKLFSVKLYHPDDFFRVINLLAKQMRLDVSKTPDQLTKDALFVLNNPKRLSAREIATVFEQTAQQLGNTQSRPEPAEFKNPFDTAMGMTYYEPKAPTNSHTLISTLIQTDSVRKSLSPDEEFALAIKLSRETQEAAEQKRMAKPAPVPPTPPSRDDKETGFESLTDDAVLTEMQTRLSKIEALLQESARRTKSDPVNRVFDKAVSQLPEQSLPDLSRHRFHLPASATATEYIEITDSNDISLP